MKNPRWTNKNPKKTQGQISMQLAQISGKKFNFPEETRLFPTKI